MQSQCHFPKVMLWCLLLTVTSGCGNNDRAIVTGQVTLDNKLLDTGIVVFHPMRGGATAIGAIEDDGSYSLMTGREIGLAPGEYDVTVQAREPIKLPTDNRSSPTPGKMITPLFYADVTTSPLNYSVNQGGNEIDLKLDSSASSKISPK